MDVVKTRLQVQGISRHEIPFRNGRDAFIRILRSEGPWAFTKGATARIMWLAPNTAITIGICEYCCPPPGPAEKRNWKHMIVFDFVGGGGNMIVTSCVCVCSKMCVGRMGFV